jgi:thiamine biosynthesis lipoprotein
VLASEATLIETRFRALGPDVHVAVVEGGPALLASAEARIRALARRWSRFLDTSEVSRLNRSGGRAVVVSADTFDLVARAVHAWEVTRGRFDPTIGAALAAHGYDRDFAGVASRCSASPRATSASPGAGGIDLLGGATIVRLPAGVTFDPGGIGKGLAADLTATMLVAEGAAGALVNIGGDLRAVGRPPAPGGWVISVADPLRPDAELLRAALPNGGVASSSRLLRRWRTTEGEAHHLIDPTTGRPADTAVVAVTVVAAEAWWAEVLTKQLFLTGPSGLGDLDRAHAVVVTDDGRRHASPDLEGSLR